MSTSLARISWLCAGLAVVAIAALPSTARAVDLTSGGGFLFDISDFSSGELSNGTIDAYDGCYYLEVGGETYSGDGTFLMSPDGRTITLPESTLSGVRVQRIIYVPASGGDWARYLDVLTNPGSSDVTVTVRVYGNLGSDSGTSVFASSSGDTAVSSADQWFSTDDSDGSSDPSLAHLFQGEGVMTPATSASIEGDNIEYSYDVVVPGGGRAAILTFALQTMTQAMVQAEAIRLLELPEDAIIGLDDYASDIVNFSLGSFTEPCVGVAELGACTTPRGDAGACRSGSCCAGCWNGTRCVSGRAASACGRRGTMCATCADTDACTSDICSDTGMCTYPDAPRGTFCDDGLFCTASDRCDGSGNCGGAGNRCDDAVSCTTDVCTEATESCVNTPPTDQCIIGRACVARGASPAGFACLVCDPARNPRGWVSTGGVCAIGGECVMPGTRHAGYPCLVCDPARNENDWSPLPTGDSCGDAFCTGGHVVTGATCSATGVCLAGTSTACEAGYCQSETECASMCDDGECPAGTFCAPSGVCERRRADGSSCEVDGDCVTNHCVDRICCSEACTEGCRSCVVPGNIGTCTDVPAMTDPDHECPGGFCDEFGACFAGDAGPITIDAGTSTTDAGPGVDAARFIDAGSAFPDADLGPPDDEGCACSAPGASSRSHTTLVTLALLGLALVARRRSR